MLSGSLCRPQTHPDSGWQAEEHQVVRALSTTIWTTGRRPQSHHRIRKLRNQLAEIIDQRLRRKIEEPGEKRRGLGKSAIANILCCVFGQQKPSNLVATTSPHDPFLVGPPTSQPSHNSSKNSAKSSPKKQSPKEQLRSGSAAAGAAQAPSGPQSANAAGKMRWCCGGGQSPNAQAGNHQRNLELTGAAKTVRSNLKKSTKVVSSGEPARVQLLENQPNSGRESSPRPKGVLKSSLKLLKRNQTSSTQSPDQEKAGAHKGVQYADDVWLEEHRSNHQDRYSSFGGEKWNEEESLLPGDSSHFHYTSSSSEPRSPGGFFPMKKGAGGVVDKSGLDKYGPMLLRPRKKALYVAPESVLGNCGQSSPSTSGSIPAGCPFLEKLQSTGWMLHTSTPESAVHSLQSCRPVVVLIDHKINDLIPFARNLRNLPECEDMLFGVLVDGVPSDQQLRALADVNLQQFFLYSATDISVCELFARLASRLRAIPALFAVVEEAEQPIKICDERNVVQYVNRAYELVTGRARADVLGSDASEMRQKALTNNVAVAAITASATAAAVGWQGEGGTASSPTTEGESLSTTATYTGTGNGQHHHNNRRRSSEWHCITVPSSSKSPQFVYVKRGSADAAICRDLSLKSLRSQSALVDAPITEALSVLSNVLHKCDEDTQMQVRDAIKILSATELYAPTITRFRDSDKIATGYYDGLIRLHHPNRQRKRSVVDAFRENQHRRASGGSNASSGADSRRRISTDVVNALESEISWEFDVIELERITDHHPLTHLGIKIFERWNVPETLRCSTDSLARWFQVIEANYQSGNAYHNATHAADVLQATSHFLNSDAVGQHVQDTHAVAALIAATIHDLDHPGRGNAFLMNTRQRLALLYNDHSVLENHHVALAFQLTLSQPGVNIFAKVPHDEFSQIRQATIDMVLATDMSRHFEYLTKFQQLMTNLPDTEENRDANSLTICRMMIKCADIANPTREWKLCHQWAMRIVEEYFDQTAEESAKGLPLTMKGFDRETCNIPMTQCTFVDMFARETFTSWCEFAELPEILVQLELNYEKWKQLASDWEPTKQNRSLSMSEANAR
ncbi:3'5'-cyclic nucleotide phosphodiesterase domain-containing protein [Ditylenchus destructor]|uniref:Phosphodiesterase n=1 Tax=Ditylenchus destructor TaxID=166010 RepID=A0AAD4R172_9BILA|nr:3'5'-cyclic nucleotide phosphodiesterase domain-containing protein [Ditylenchus destructor]